MSHFSVAVFSHDPKQVDELLAPFNEVVKAGSPYAEFVEDAEAEIDEATGKRGYWHNPKARWDWYTIGGRWRGLLRLKEGFRGKYDRHLREEEKGNLKPGFCDSAQVSSCNFSPKKSAYEKAIRFWEVVVEGAPQTAQEKAGSYMPLFKPEYYIQQYGDKETYAKQAAEFSTYAFVTAKGEWFETGRMGWFGMDDATRDTREAYMEAFRSYMKVAEEEDLYITIVDCHI